MRRERRQFTWFWIALGAIVLLLALSFRANAQYGLGNLWTDSVYIDADVGTVGWYESGPANDLAAYMQYVKSSDTFTHYIGTNGTSKLDVNVTKSGNTANLYDYNVTSTNTFTISEPITMVGSFIGAAGGTFQEPIAVQSNAGSEQIKVEDTDGDLVVTIGAGQTGAGRIQLGTDADDTVDWEIQWTAANTATIPSGDTLVVSSYLTVGDILKATPQAGKGATCATQGQVYYSSTDNVPCFCDGTNWKKITDGTTNCS